MKIQVLQSNYNIYLNIFRHPYAEPTWLSFVRKPLLEIGVEVLILPFEEIDKSKPWLVNVHLLPWNLNNFEQDLLLSFDEHIQNELLYGNAHLLMSNETEADSLLIIESILYNKILKNTLLKKNKIIYMCNGVEVEEKFKEFVDKNSLSKHEQISVWFSPHCFNAFFPENILSYEAKVNKEKTYLFLNRMCRINKIMMASMLSYYGLIEHGYVSLGITLDKIDTGTLSEIYKDSRIGEGFTKLKDKLPIVLDTTDFVSNHHAAYNSLPTQYYQNSYFSLVSSTYALKTQETCIGITEKEYKPMILNHPFIIFNRPHTLKHLKSMGFMTFEKWFDESYDDVVDDLQRMEKIVLEVKRLTTIKHSEWEKNLEQMKPILLHNYNRVVNYKLERCYFNSDLKKFLHYVS